MKKNLIKLVIFTLILLILDRFIAASISTAAITRQFDTRIQDLMEGNIDAGLLILGSSRSARDLIPVEIEKETGIKSFSLAFPGSNVDFHESILRFIIASKKIPKEVILAVDDDFELTDNENITYREDLLYPYIKYWEINKILAEREKKNLYLSAISRTYAENLNLETALDYLEKGKLKPELLTEVQTDGSMTLKTKSDSYEALKFDESQKIYDRSNESQELLDKFLDFIELCKENSIKLYIIFPPILRTPTSNFPERIKELANSIQGADITYLDFSNLYKDKTHFYDMHHLDYGGAVNFSQEISKMIK